MRAGPKAAVTAPPLDLSALPKRRGDRAVAFVEGYLQVPKGTGARKPLRLRPWQRKIVRGAFGADVRQALVSLPRGNGKSTLAAALALYGLLADRVEGAQVLCVASDERQARIVFNAARRMVELNDELADRVQVFQDRLYVPHTDSTLAPLPAEPGALQGWDPSLCVLDELHVVTRDTYEAMATASGKRDRSLLLAISTPAGDKDGSVMYDLVEHGRRADDGSFYFTEFAAPKGCDLDDEDAWHVANPALGDFLQVDALRATLRTTRESSFRRFRLGQWVDQVEGAWLPDGAWDAVTDPDATIPDGADVVLGLDGSFSQDCTALVAVTVTDPPHIEVVGLWENPGDEHYRVPVADVEVAVQDAARRWQVVEVAADPFRWTRTLQALEAEGLPMVEFPQSAPRMTRATTQLYEAITNGDVTHSGDDRLARHVANCVLKVDARGHRLAKEHRDSRRKIDLAVAAVMAHDRALWHRAQPVPTKRSGRAMFV